MSAELPREITREKKGEKEKKRKKKKRKGNEGLSVSSAFTRTYLPLE